MGAYYLNLSNGVTVVTLNWPEFGFPTNRAMAATDKFNATNAPANLTISQTVTLGANDAALWTLTPQ